jgi:SAM-dependent methyltransferase
MAWNECLQAASSRERMPRSPDDLEGLQAERDAADREYNEALTRLDHAIQRLPDDFPHAPPPLDEFQVTPLNARWRIDPPTPEAGWRGWFAAAVRRTVEPMFERQQAFNSAVVDHVNRNLPVHRQTRESIASTLAVLREQLGELVRFQSLLVMFLQQITPYVDTRDRDVAGLLRGLSGAINAVADELMKRSETALARDRRHEARVGGLETALAALQQQALALTRVVEQLEAGPHDSGGPASAITEQLSAAPKYAVFEEQFRGSVDEVRRRLADYVDDFVGASDVIDLGCGRGEFLSLLRERGIAARGVDASSSMVAACIAAGVDATQADAIQFLSAMPDASVGGIFSAQMVEHLESGDLLRLLEAAVAKLKPGAKIVIETINPACWAAFFEGYLRDPTHVRPIHPDTLRLLLQTSGFHRVDVRFRAPVAADEKLQHAPAAESSDGALAGTFDRNVDRLNSLLFTYRDYAVVGERL